MHKLGIVGSRIGFCLIPLSLWVVLWGFFYSALTLLYIMHAYPARCWRDDILPNCLGIGASTPEAIVSKDLKMVSPAQDATIGHPARPQA
ncbi:hypothetical protein BJX62DRAFT_183202 [Aspergillus germanicus]